jgi:hypothetical protein
MGEKKTDSPLSRYRGSSPDPGPEAGLHPFGLPGKCDGTSRDQMIISHLGVEGVKEEEIFPPVGFDDHRGIDKPHVAVEEKDQRNSFKSQDLEKVFGKYVRFQEKLFSEKMGHELFNTQILSPFLSFEKVDRARRDENLS